MVESPCYCLGSRTTEYVVCVCVWEGRERGEREGGGALRKSMVSKQHPLPAAELQKIGAKHGNYRFPLNVAYSIVSRAGLLRNVKWKMV